MNRMALMIPFAAIWIQLETTTPSEVRERQLPYDITHMWNLKYDTNESIFETDTQSGTKGQTGGQGGIGESGGGGWSWQT